MSTEMLVDGSICDSTTSAKRLACMERYVYHSAVILNTYSSAPQNCVGTATSCLFDWCIRSRVLPKCLMSSRPGQRCSKTCAFSSSIVELECATIMLLGSPDPCMRAQERSLLAVPWLPPRGNTATGRDTLEAPRDGAR